MDRVAAALRLDPVELRLKNMVEPYDTDLVTGLPLGDARVRECLERGAVAFDWAARRARPPAGVACGEVSASPPAPTRTACSAPSPRPAAWASR